MGKRKANRKKSVRNNQITIRNEVGSTVKVPDTHTSENNSAFEVRSKDVTMDAEIEASHLSFSFNHSGNSFKFCALVEAFTMKVSVKSAEITRPVHSSKPITIITVQEINVHENIEGKPSDINATLDVSQISIQMADCYKSSKVNAKINISKIKASIKAEEIGNSTSEGQKSSHRKRKSKIILTEIVTDIDDFEVNDSFNSTKAIKNDPHPSSNTVDIRPSDSLPDKSSDLEKCSSLWDNSSDLENSSLLSDDSSDLEMYSLFRDNSSDLEKYSLLRDNSSDSENTNLLRDNSSDLEKCNLLRDNSNDLEKCSLLRENSNDLEKCNLLRDNSSDLEKCNFVRDNSSDLEKSNLFQDYDLSDYGISNSDNCFLNELFQDIENISSLCCELFFAIPCLLFLTSIFFFLATING